MSIPTTGLSSCTAFLITAIRSASLAGAFPGGGASTTSPIFARKLIPALIKDFEFEQKRKRKREELDRFYNSFYYLRKKGLLKMEYRGKQLYVSLSDEGKLLAKKYSIDDIQIHSITVHDVSYTVMGT